MRSLSGNQSVGVHVPMSDVALSAMLALGGCGGGGSSPGAVAPKQLSPAAELGERIFCDASLLASGAMSCETCHSPNHAHAQPTTLAVPLGGAGLNVPGFRNAPSLRYLNLTPPFFFDREGTPTTDFTYDNIGGPRNPGYSSQRGPCLFRSGAVWPLPDRSGEPHRPVWCIQGAHLAQRRPDRPLFPQRALCHLAIGAAVLCSSRYQSRRVVSAGPGRRAAEVRRPAGATPRERQHHRCALPPRAGRCASAERARDRRSDRLPRYADRRFQAMSGHAGFSNPTQFTGTSP